jgi:DNA polymerase-3 subunit gamma/tau
MGQALYRKYRPTSFEEAVGQEHVTTTLKHAIKSGKISHAYLFTGPRGIGKTSVARILAHEVNGLTYNDGSTHLDIIEIDAASNRRIDEIRELRDKVHITPTSAKYKVYIIDEVHMLTREAFNALLKTLEEPPAHCIFILATTEVHKLPETIISRTQRFSFNPVGTKLAAQHLKSIAKKEKIDVTDEALELISEHGQGSFRDSISLLDQLSNSKGQINEETVRNLLGLPEVAAINEIENAIENGDSRKLLECLENLAYQGVNAAAIAKSLGAHLRGMLISGNSSAWIPKLLRELLEVSASTNPNENLEISLLEAALANQAMSTKITSPSGSYTNPTSPKKKVSEAKITQSAPAKMSTSAPNVQTNTQVNIKFDIEHWPSIVEYAKKHAASLYTALKIAKPVVENDVLILYFQFPLHQKKLNQSKQKDIIGQIIEEVSNVKIKVECQVNKDMFKDEKREDAKKSPAVKQEQAAELHTPMTSISNIFGKAEVLESN